MTVALLSSAISVAALDFTNAQTGSVHAQQNTSESEGDTPGEIFSVAIGIQGAEVEEIIQCRTLNTTLASATTPKSLAVIIVGETRTIDARLNALSGRYETLSARNTSGDDARKTVLRAEGKTLDCRIERLSQAATKLPADVRSKYNITDRELSVLSARANALSDDKTGTTNNSTRNNGANATRTADDLPPRNEATPTQQTTKETPSTAADGPPTTDQSSGGNESTEDEENDADDGAGDDDADDRSGDDDTDDGPGDEEADANDDANDVGRDSDAEDDG